MNQNGIREDVHVTVEYVLRDDGGEILDSSGLDDGEPIRYVHGYGMLVPGLEAGLSGMQVGEGKKITISAEDGFGQHDDDLVLEIDRTEFPDPSKVEVGEEFVAESADGDEAVMRVVEVRDDSVVVDANHPLAGMTLHYEVRILEIRPATADELEEARQAAEEALALAEAMHTHEHEAGGASLVQLGKKPLN